MLLRIHPHPNMFTITLRIVLIFVPLFILFVPFYAILTAIIHVDAPFPATDADASTRSVVVSSNFIGSVADIVAQFPFGYTFLQLHNPAALGVTLYSLIALN